MHILILGGTSEASALTQLLTAHPNVKATLSLAGRTKKPVLPHGIEHRVGGFGGAEGLATWLQENKVTAIVDATHPFASRMPFNAAKAASENKTPILSLLRPEWMPEPNDRWTEVADHNAAIALLGTSPRRVFLTVGRVELPAYTPAPQHFYVVRSIDPIDSKPLPNAIYITGRGPFSSDREAALMRKHNIEIVVTKNSGGSATGAKIEAARQLGLPVIAIRRPAKPDVARVTDAEAAMDWILRTHNASS